MLAGALRCVHKVPAGLKGFCGRDFKGNVLSVLHCIEGHGNVVYPVCADVHKVHVRVFTELLVNLFIAGIYLGGHSAAFKDLEVLFCPVRLYVADGCHVASGNKGKTMHGTAAAVSEANYADTYIGNGLSGKLKHGFLTRRTGGDGSLDNLCRLAAGNGGKDCSRQDDGS